uniref:Uncharacterized protein n=1 Tax=Solanum tuberosum TaxID=4113 RepID=M1DGZ0_SOLTU
MTYQICNLTRCADVRVVRVEAYLPKFLEWIRYKVLSLLGDSLTRCEASIESLGVRLDNLIARLEARKNAEEEDDDRVDYNLSKETYVVELRREKVEQTVSLTPIEFYGVEETMVSATLERSLKDTSTIGTSGVS